MNSLAIVFSVIAMIFASSIGGMLVRRKFGEHLLPANTTSLIQFVLGLTASLSALVLGLLVASSFTLFNAQKTGVETLSARAVELDRLLRQFGPEAAPGRQAIKNALTENYRLIWGRAGSNLDSLGIGQVVASSDEFVTLQDTLVANTEAKKRILSRIEQAAQSMQQTRDLMSLQIASPVTWPLLVILTVWISILFFGYGLLSDLNGVAISGMAGGALVVGCAIFLILDLSHSYSGLIRIPSTAIETAIKVVGN
jgi:hypothetical protein